MVEQMNSRTVSIIELSRQHEVSRSVLFRWRKQHEDGSLDNTSLNAPLASKMTTQELEQLVGRLTLENEALKKVMKLVHSPLKPDVNLSERTKVYSGILPGGAEC
jgi:transposase-like protein